MGGQEPVHVEARAKAAEGSRILAYTTHSWLSRAFHCRVYW
jgi:hypothetical protein